MSDVTDTPEKITRQAAKSAKRTRYYTGRPCKNGHTDERLVSNGRCAACLREYKAINREQVNAAQRKNRQKYPERWSRHRKKQYWKDPDKARRQSREYSKKRTAANPHKRTKYRNKLAKELANRMRCRMWHALKRGKNHKSIESVLGYTIDELKTHLERQFTKGMSWENRSKWDIDHIVPVSSFDIKSYSDDEFKACWALTNLRPLWRNENRRKWSVREHLL